jgi:phage terminase large subunit-like protein
MNNDLTKKLLTDNIARTKITSNSHLWFFSVYFAHYIWFEIAPFQREIFALTERQDTPLTVIVAFRSSAKSTIITMSYALWAILGVQQKKFVVIISQTMDQAKQHFKNIKQELVSNKLLQRDLGPFQEDEWNAGSLVLPKYNARITVASTEQSIRGIKHGQYRPDLVICDDIDDIDSVKTAESRNKTYDWFNGEVLPLGEKTTKIIVVGNLLHEDCLIMRLQKEISEGTRTGIFRKYPLVDDHDNILWLGKYPNMAAIEKERLDKGDKYSWNREYLLIIIDKREAVVQKGDIKYYDIIPEPKRDESNYYAIGIDPAGGNEKGDNTAIVVCRVIGSGKNLRIYVLPNPINEKLGFRQTVDATKIIANQLGSPIKPRIYVENVALQTFMSEQLAFEGYDCEDAKVGNVDKRTKLIAVHCSIASGIILFPKSGAEALIKQLLGFGVEKFDDLVDAFTLIGIKIIEKRNASDYTGPMFVDWNHFGRTPSAKVDSRTRTGSLLDREDDALYANHGRGEGNNNKSLFNY